MEIKKKSYTLTIKLSPSVYAKLGKLAVKNNRSMSAQMRQMIEDAHTKMMMVSATDLMKDV